MANGGDVSHFCSAANKHNEECEYFAGGGEIPKFDDIPGGQPEQVPSFDEIPSAGQSPQTEPQSDQVPSFDQIPVEQAGSDNAVSTPKETDYLEQAKAGAEGLARGIMGDAAELAEIKSGISTKENIDKRKKDYPLTAGATKVVGRVAPFVLAPEIAGSKLLANMLIGVSYAESDKITKALMDQPDGDPKEAVASALLHGGVDGLIDGTMYTLTDGLFSGVKGVKALQDPKIVKAAENAMISLAEKPATNAAKIALGYTGLKHLPKTVDDAIGVVKYGTIANYLKPYIEKIVEKPLSKANAYVGDAILNQLIKTNYLGIPSAIRYAQKVAAGESAVTAAMNGLFKSGETELHKAVSEDDPKSEENIKKWVEAGGVDGELLKDQQNSAQPGDYGFASGGEVQHPIQKQAFANTYPAHDMMLNSARARVSGYLNSIRPTANQMKFPFDSNTPQTDKKRQYDRAVKIAANPLSVLKNVNKGDLTVDDMKHLTQMYPEVHEHLSAKMTKKIVEAQLSGEKPSYKKRQAMSLFLGAPLDSTFTPEAITMIQGVYAMNKQVGQQQIQQKPKKSTSPLSKLAPSAMTDAQARTNREQNQKA